MTDPKTCPTCGAPLAADAPGGACPKCLLGAGFATGTGGVAAASDRVPSPEELAPRFPGLQIEHLLGRGGMGVVYKARHKALDRDVALKVLPASVAADPAFAERFQREARALARLQHPNIVLVYDFGQTAGEAGGGLFWLVMEYVDGTNIRQAMKAGQVGPKEALAIVPQICDALQYAHERGVVHRDIKPENVLLDKAGRVKVADFGLAKMMEHGELDRTLTGAGQVMGTPHYMAPEQWERPKDVDHRADIYSLGVVFYEMLTGELPVGRFAAPSKKSDVDARIDDIVLRTLEREREARYQHAQDVKTDVGRATSVGSANAPPPPARARAGDEENVEVTEDGVFVTKSGEGGRKRVVVGRHGVRVEKEGEKDVNVRWHWSSEEEKARGGRLSKLAVASAMASPVAIVGVLICAALGLDGGSATVVALTIAFVGWIASIVAWARIQSSGDRLRGRAWAAVGTFLPLPLWCVGGFLMFILTGRIAPEPPAPQESGATAPAIPAEAGSPRRETSVLAPEESDTWKVRSTVAPTPEQTGAEMQRVFTFWSDYRRKARFLDFEERIAFYAPAERERLRSMKADERDRAARSLRLGLPLVPDDLLKEEPSSFSVSSSSSWPVQSSRMGAANRIHLEVSSGAHRMRFYLITGLALDERSVYFDVAPVEIVD